MMQGYGNYDKRPFINIEGMNDNAWCGYKEIIAEVKNRIECQSNPKTVIAIDCYHGVDIKEIMEAFNALNPIISIDVSQGNYTNQEIESMLSRNITNDRVFGVMSCHKIDEFFDPQKLKQLQIDIDAVESGIVIIYGIGAALVTSPDILIYADMPRWEIQMRMRRKEVANWCTDNYDEEVLRKYKRAFFIDWRVIDRHKVNLFNTIDYLLDTTIKNQPNMITGKAHLSGLKQACTEPFRVVPFFDPGVWGGQWMKDVCTLDKSQPNYAWCFDCVPEENSLILQFGKVQVEIPSINLVLKEPQKLLGEQVHARFGAEFPIRFDFLDTMGGENLSLQVHPLTEYIQQNFGMHYTQDESYYILDAEPNAQVYLGLKENINSVAMLNDLKKAQQGDVQFDADKYVNKFPAKKHDHFLIPAGTVHCSGDNSMVLEISSTPFIFTFKLWDWGRLGMDKKPRPIHIEHGEKVIQWDRDTKWTAENLVNHVEPVAEGDGWTEERTGLHQREFIETRRHWFTKPVLHRTNGNLQVLNLIEGSEAVVSSPTNSFKEFIVHYAETFIIPANVSEYVISPTKANDGKTLGTIKAYVRV